MWLHRIIFGTLFVGHPLKPCFHCSIQSCGEMLCSNSFSRNAFLGNDELGIHALRHNGVPFWFCCGRVTKFGLLIVTSQAGRFPEGLLWHRIASWFRHKALQEPLELRMEKSAIFRLFSGLRTFSGRGPCGCPTGPRRWERGSCRLQQLLWDGGWLIAFLPRVTLLCICDCVCFKHSWTWKLQSREGNKTIFRQIRPQESEAEFIVKHEETCEAHSAPLRAFLKSQRLTLMLHDKCLKLN